MNVAGAVSDERGGKAPGADVRLLGLTKRFGDVVAVDDVTLEIPSGSFFALLGPSGCGKTTTLRMIGGLEEPTRGRVFLGDVDITDRKAYRRPVNTVFQNYALFPHLDIFENVAFGLRRLGVKGDRLRRRVGELLELVQLTGYERRRTRELSGGQQQRVALARALINEPKVLLLDEPLGALDLKLRKQMQIELKRIQTEVGVTFVHVTHDQEEAMSMADGIAVMNEGRVEQLGDPVELYEAPATAFVAGFLGQSNLLTGWLDGRDGRHAVLRVGDAKIRVPVDRVPAAGQARVGVRPEKVRLLPEGSSDEPGANVLEATIIDASFIGVSTQFIVRTPDGDDLTVFAQNVAPHDGLHAGSPVRVVWNPEHTFAVQR